MGRNRKQRRQPHGSAWHWAQTDCWYYTLPGTKKRIALFGDDGQRIRGKDQEEQADLALAKIKIAGEPNSELIDPTPESWLVARVCSEYLQYCERGVANGTISASHHANSVAFLNDFCAYCGALTVGQLKKGHVKTWIESHAGWKSLATHRSVISIVLAAFGRAEEMQGLPNPLKGLKKPASQPRLQSFSAEDEQALYGSVEVCFKNFLFAAIHTGLRPFCELARVTADHIEESDRGMMWRVYSSKTKKTRKIPVRREVAELTRKLLVKSPRGSGLPIFRNTKDKPWTPTNGVVRFIALKKKLHWNEDKIKSKYSCYTCRHTFVHRMLSGYWTNGVGCSIETVAELIGDTPKVAFDHYGREWGQHYQDPLWAAIGVPAMGRVSQTPVSPSGDSPPPQENGTAKTRAKQSQAKSNAKDSAEKQVKKRPKALSRAS